MEAIGWREAALAAVIVLAAYAGYALLKLANLRAQPLPPAGEPPASQATAIRALQEQMRTLESTLAQLREDVAQLKAARTVAPQYEEAVGLAARGFDAQAIAQRCGISVAEAELVRALARGGGASPQ